ncbi:MAG: GNAT family N-acetyltransferase [Planctomycetes bacterium]|nr:GNAT family N-acetyltransferase [Planctomycetota bacterium]
MIKIRQMTIDDVQLGLKLTRQAGWNQTESDWLRFMKMEPEGCFVAEFGGRSVGTTTTCILGHVAWIAMVLVDVDARGKGVGTELLKYSLNYLDKRKVKTVRLDATSAGQPIYEKLGFTPEYQLARFEGIAPSGKRGALVSKATPAIYVSIIEFDTQMNRTNRGKMLSRLFEDFPEDIHIIWDGGKIEGFILTRPGANAIQIGPCIATIDAGPVLLSDALSRCAAEPVFIDIPVDNTNAVKIAESSGLRIQRYFMRMYRGEYVKDHIQALWAGSGPEKG